MTELLKRWSRLEPSRCEAARRSAWLRLGNGWSGPIGAEVPYYRADMAREQAHVLAAVIEAIEAHGLLWSIERNPRGITATVRTLAGTLIGITESELSAAVGLLGAYLAALEAEVEK